MGLKNILIRFNYIAVLLSVPCAAFADPEPGSSDWYYEVSKAIAVELADSPAWSMASPYLRELAIVSQDWNVLLLTAKVELQQGNLDAARLAVEKALALYPNNPRILAMAGNVASDSGQSDAAESYYKRVLAIQPHNTQVLTSLARIYYARKDWTLVIETYKSLNRLAEPTSEVLVRMATACENTGNLECAEDSLKRNLDVHPNRVIALLTLERFYQRTGAADKAERTAAERTRLQKTTDSDTRVLRALPNSSR